MNILVLCTGNSARSILLEAILNHRSSGRVVAHSAGSHPAGRVHPQALAELTRQGVPSPAARSKSWDEFALPGAPVMDAVITVCSSAAGETCPLWPGAPLRSHWGEDDPAAAPAGDQPAAFAHAFARLDARATAFLGALAGGQTLDQALPAGAAT
ncbi:MAG: arsenate reductase ArsC [Paracoccaceae bacterium]